MFCPKCGKENREDANFCYACGVALGESASRSNSAPDVGEANEKMGAPESPQKQKKIIEDLGGGVKLEMAWIPGGTFMMGSPDSEEERRSNEGPQTQVSLDGFWMGTFAVTQEQYQRVTEMNPSALKEPKNPVEGVSWRNAMDFCARLSDEMEKPFALPTEAQWEYACRAGSQTRFCFGDSDSDLGEYGWCLDNAEGVPHPVGEKKPNAFGLYDMHGNVSEWCFSKFKDYPYSDADERNNHAIGGDRVLRGGCWFNYSWFCRSASRFKLVLSVAGKNAGFGFRVVAPSR